MLLQNKTFLVTGAASGLGAAVAYEFHSAGANLILFDRSAAAGETHAKILGKSARLVTGDVTSGDDVQAAIDTAVREFGDIHGAVHCAGILHAGKLVGKNGSHSLEDFQRVINVNLSGTFNVLRLTSAAMTINRPDANDERGVIILTSSIAAEEGQIGQTAYAASKAGVAGMTLPAARELAKFGIRVVTIAPGVFDTGMMEAASPEIRESLAAQIPFPSRFGQPPEYAALARHIVENAMLNGCVIRLDGALRMSSK
jgi:NAD(P)-dependent dehydrogenase (short-subunit alcohol dehydrogenase family)